MLQIFHKNEVSRWKKLRLQTVHTDRQTSHLYVVKWTQRDEERDSETTIVVTTTVTIALCVAQRTLPVRSIASALFCWANELSSWSSIVIGFSSTSPGPSSFTLMTHTPPSYTLQSPLWNTATPHALTVWYSGLISRSTHYTPFWGHLPSQSLDWRKKNRLKTNQTIT